MKRMDLSKIAKQLGRRGGLQRARNLSQKARREIARQGAEARVESLRLSKRIQSNFDFVAIIYQFHPPQPVVSRSTCEERLPSIHDQKYKF